MMGTWCRKTSVVVTSCAEQVPASDTLAHFGDRCSLFARLAQ
jgi:hypothetical protein